MHWNQTEHSYEELREVVMSVMLDGCNNGPEKFEKILEKTASTFTGRTRLRTETSLFLMVRPCN